jgi:hypothetical protein
MQGGFLSFRRKQKRNRFLLSIMFTISALNWENTPTPSCKSAETMNQFHQHFARSFFVWKFNPQLFYTYILGLYFIGAEAALRMLVKLTICLSVSIQSCSVIITICLLIYNMSISISWFLIFFNCKKIL